MAAHFARCLAGGGGGGGRDSPIPLMPSRCHCPRSFPLVPACPRSFPPIPARSCSLSLLLLIHPGSWVPALVGAIGPCSWAPALVRLGRRRSPSPALVRLRPPSFVFARPRSCRPCPRLWTPLFVSFHLYSHFSNLMLTFLGFHLHCGLAISEKQQKGQF